MKEFAQLISALESTNKTNARIDAIVDYLERAPEKDKLWFISLFTGKRPRRHVSTSLMKEWALEITGLPFWLFIECHAAVGDLGETLSLVLPPPDIRIEKSLAEWMQEIIQLKDSTEEEKKVYVITSWSGLDYTERLIFNKLIGGSFRIGVSHKTLVNALAKLSGQEASVLMHSIMGKWSVDEISFAALLAGTVEHTDNSKPYPFCLAYALEKEPGSLGEPGEWLVEYKWDGIRGQVVSRQGEVYIWSRGEELITEQFPELVAAVEGSKKDFVIDGEILVVREGDVQNFNELQKRLNRKNVTRKVMEALPVQLFAYDLLELGGKDMRPEPLNSRRAVLEELVNSMHADNIRLSPFVDFSEWQELDIARNNARTINSEGLMLKHRQSVYHAGRRKGDWWKWKIDPLTIDAVLIYAQKGSGRRSGYYTDYTFAVKNGPELVTIAKAYSGLTDKEIMEVSRFVTRNAVEKFGPVRTVRPELVFEIAFEGIGWSNRHKSGIALRFPRILRWRRDKKADEIDTLEDVKKLIV